MKTGKAKKIRKRRSALTAIVTLLVMSALLRMGEHAGQAVARETAALETEADQTGPAEVAPDIEAVLRALQDREARVAEREERLALRMTALEEAEIEVQMRIDEMREAETALRATLALADEAAEKDIARLTSVYENMKPKEASDLFETMDPAFAAGFLGRMKPAAAAGIMAGLTPETAYAISVVLAGRNAEVPTE